MPLWTDHTSPEDAAGKAAALGDVDLAALLAQLPDDVLLFDRRGRLLHSTTDVHDDEFGPVPLRGPVQSAIREGCTTSVLVPLDDCAEDARFATVSPLRSADGSTDGAVVVLRNDPLGDQLVDAVRAHEFDSLAAALPDIILRFDASGRLIFENGRLSEQVDLAQRRLLGGHPSEYTGTDFDGVAEFDAALTRVLGTGESDETRLAFTAPDGTRRVHVVRFRATHGLDGTIGGAIAIGREITDLERMRGELERRESEIRSLADGIPDVVLRYDLDGRATYANQHWIETLGRDPSMILGKRPTESTQPGTVGVDLYEQRLMRVLDTGEPAGITIQVARPDGDLRTHSVYFRAHRGAGGAIIGAIALGRDITDLVRAEQRALDREREFRTLAEHLPDVVLRYDCDGRMTYTNHRLGELVEGFDANPYGKRPTEHQLPGVIDIEGYERALLGVISTGEPITYPIRQALPSGEVIQHDVRIAVERDESGTIIGAIAIGRDVTDLVRAEQRALDRERDFRTLAEHLPDVVNRFDRQGRVRYANRPISDVIPGANDDLGFHPSEKELPGILNVEDFETALAHVLESGEESVAEIHQILPSGERREHQILVCAERDESGEIIGAISIARDVTDLVVARQQVAEREREFRDLAENNTDFIARYDPNGFRTYVNPALAAIYGTTPDELVGRHADPHPDGRSKVLDAVVQVVEDRQLRSVELRLEHPATGQQVVHDVRLIPEFDTMGEFVSVLAIGRDITDIVAAQQQAADREREFRTLAENNTDYVSRWDINGVRTYVNRALARLYGMSADELVGQPATRDNPHDQVAPAVLDVIREREARELQWQWTHPKTGRQIIHQVRVIPEFDADGEFVSVLSIGHDVTALIEAQRRVADRERQFRTLAENNTDYIARYDLDGVRVYVNEALAHLYGTTPDELVGRPIEETLQGRSDLLDAIAAVIHDREPRAVEERIIEPATGTEAVQHIRLIPEFDTEGEFVSVLAIGRDITELVEAQQKVVDREREYRTLAENNTDHIARWDTDGVRIYVNPALARLHGRPAEELIGLRATSLGDRSDVVGPAIFDVIRERQPRSVQQRLVDPSTGEWMVHDVRLIPEFDTDGELVSVLGIGRDVTEALRHQDELAKAASTDVLTGIASRGVLYERLPEVLAARNADGNGGALILLDLDGFKAINDHFGHQFGDRILQEAARRLSQCIGPDDLLVRLGGDEFVMVLSRIETPGDASLVAHQARTQLTALERIDGIRLPPVDVCMGIAFLPSDGGDVDELLAHADLALYEAKRRGRGNVEYFRRDLRAAMERRTTLEHALRACDPDREMSVHLQPIYRLGDCTAIWGAEALLRWEHPTLGPIRPDEFILIAEQTGDIITLGRWVLRQVAELAVEVNTRRAVPLQFSVNVSSRQFTLGDIEDAVREAMAATGVDPRWLTIELTESLLLDDIPQVNRSLKTLSELGVSLAIDDFGTGYSALQYLTRLDIDCLKIDKSFVHGSEVDVQQREIVRAIVALANALGIGIVAEGIETSTQVAFLRHLGCDLGQGYLLARPMPSGDFERWLAETDAATDDTVTPTAGG